MKYHLSLWIILLLPFQTLAQPAEKNNTLEQLMNQWLELESQKGRLQAEWSVRKAELERRASLLDIEKKTLKDVVTQENKTNSDVDERRLSLLKRQDELEVEQTLMSSQLKTLLASIQSLQPKLPPPLQTQWNDKLPLLLQEGASNSEKLERSLNMLMAAEEFNNRIALHRTTMNIPVSGAESQVLMVTQIYLGNSQGWYVSDDGKTYGYGRSTSLGWNWWHGDSATAELGRKLDPSAILQVRAILENPTTATFVSLPIKI